MAAVFYNGPEPLAIALFEPLLKLKLLANSTQNRAYWTMNTLLNDDLRAGHRRSMKGSAFSFPLDYQFVKDCLQDFSDLIQQTPDAFMSIMVFEFFPYKKICSVIQGHTAFANRGAYGNLLWICGWTKEENDEEIRQWTRDQSDKARGEFERWQRWTRKKDGVTEDGECNAASLRCLD